jgi:hypothetical protein
MPNLIGRLDRPFSDHFNQMVQLSELDNANTFAYQIIATMLLQSIFSTVRTDPRPCCCKMAKLETEINYSFLPWPNRQSMFFRSMQTHLS